MTGLDAVQSHLPIVLHDDMMSWWVFKYSSQEKHFLNWIQAWFISSGEWILPVVEKSQVVNIVYKYKTRMCSGTRIITCHWRPCTLQSSALVWQHKHKTHLKLKKEQKWFRVSNVPSQEWSSGKMSFFCNVSICSITTNFKWKLKQVPWISESKN